MFPALQLPRLRAAGWLAVAAALAVPSFVPASANASVASVAAAPSASARGIEQVARIQRALKARGLDGWLFYEFRGTNPIANRVLLLPPDGGGSRRWLCFIPAEGPPVRIVHAIEPRRLDHLPGEKIVYSAWPTLQAAIRQALAGRKTVAMEYSPEGAIPYVARVDAGTVEFVRTTGVSVVTSADLVQEFEAVWSPAQRTQHERAAHALRQVVNEAWVAIARAILAGEAIDERAVQAFCVRRKEQLGLTLEPPIVAVNANAADPHYFPAGPRSSPIRRGDLVLIDIVGKVREPHAVHADITWVGIVADQVPEPVNRIWQIVRDARDAAIAFVRDGARRGALPAGFEVDDVARGAITQAGYGAQFIHRTGHAIGEEVHGNGTHLDNFETHDERRLLPGTGFSIEPGIYLPGEFGIRSEVNIYLDGHDAVITGGEPQREIVRILAPAR